MRTGTCHIGFRCVIRPDRIASPTARVAASRKRPGWVRPAPSNLLTRTKSAWLPARRPDWLFLDEATASLDLESEAHLYRIIKERLPRATIVSIAHRQSVAEFHDHKLVLQREGDRPQRLFSQTVRAAAAE
jgi:hypothetical protein